VLTDPLSIAYLRALATYRDETGATSTLFDRLKDNVLTPFSGIGFIASASWRYIEFERSWLDRYQVVTLAISTGNPNVFLAVSADGMLWTYYASTGFGGAMGNVGNTLAVAQANAATWSTFTTNRIELYSAAFAVREIREARFVRLYHRDPASNYYIDEFYPRRITETDDLIAECVKAINLSTECVTADKIGAGAVTAAKINVSQLSAIAADMGSLTAGTITGALIRSAAAGRRWEGDTNGLRTYNSAGAQQCSIATDADGAIKAGGGAVIIDANGIATVQNGAYGAIRSYNVKRSDGAIIADMYGFESGGIDFAYFNAKGIGSNAARVNVVADSPSGTSARAWLTASSGSNPVVYVQAKSENGASGINLVGAVVSIEQGINVGAATGAATGEIGASGSAGIGASAYSDYRLYVRGASAGTSKYTAVFRNSAAADLLFLRDDGFAWVNQNWTIPSDRAYKDEIADIDDTIVDRFLAIRLRQYRRKDQDNAKLEYGVIAQELSESFPEFVAESQDGKLGVRYGDLIPVLAKVVQHVAARLTRLERGRTK
jgi:hypothetical protein